MERLTFMSGDDYWAIDNENCFDDQNEDYCGPAIDRLAAYEDTGLEPNEIKKLVSQRNAMAALADSYKAEIPHWIPVSDRLPESSQRVIVCRENGKVEQGVFLGVNGWWKVYGTNTKAVTHWMPMPVPPEEG